MLLQRAAGGDSEAQAAALPLVYNDLRRLAAAHLRRERPGQTLQPTDLVHEVYLRLARHQPLTLDGRAHFFGIAARAMRQILIERARARHAGKRGGALIRVTMTDAVAAAVPATDAAVDVEALHQALDRLGETDAGLAQLVELRCFAGLTIEQAAEALGVSVATVKRRWTLARAWLYRELAGSIHDL